MCSALQSGRRRRGVGLLESLIAMGVAAAALLGLLSMQTLLSCSADAAKQRSEAVRLADEQIESMRPYTKIASTPGQLAWADLAAGTDAVSTNATYMRAWTIDGSAADTLRQVTVTLSWQDRAGEAPQMVLSSVIAQMDPADVGALGFPLPANTTLKRPKNRNLNIPVPARELGNGQSVCQLANFALVFNNDSGYVVQRCDTAPETPSSSLTGAELTTALTAALAEAGCQATDALIDGYKYCLCILPITTSARWSGTVRLSGMASGTNYRVCRFQYPAAAGQSPNPRNVQPSVDVADALDSRSYIITTASSCPTVSSLPTTLHQVCTSSNDSRTSDCPES